MVRGVVGRIEWGYFTAAAINGYTVTRDRDGTQWRLRGTVVMSDGFKLSQRPLIFVAPYAHGEWRWPIQELAITDGAVHAQLGPPLM